MPAGLSVSALACSRFSLFSLFFKKLTYQKQGRIKGHMKGGEWFPAKGRKGEKAMMYYVVDIRVTEKTDSLDHAREIAEAWMDSLRDTCNYADDYTITRRLRSGTRGLDAGDVEIWECDDDCEHWYDGERIERYDGRAVTEAEAEKRGIRA